jgi:hypothetical protein
MADDDVHLELLLAYDHIGCKMSDLQEFVKSIPSKIKNIDISTSTDIGAMIRVEYEEISWEFEFGFLCCDKILLWKSCRRNGKRFGYQCVYHTNGIVAIRGFYLLDKRDGLWEERNYEGELTNKKSYENGRLIS